MKLPRGLSGRDLRRALERAGFEFLRQRGSHMFLKRNHPPARVSIPDHPSLRPGTLRQILHESGLTVESLIRPL
ncbi:MAG: type II toxin-antitoxin system HicA family toxin [Acidobacteria bacterium]|nr:type II toxin-antitoxin system HicA family toxin [Acidobacteriota bacterium]